jgi:hypothetical protein
MGTELALYWSLLSVYTSSVMSAYLRPPLRGVLGAGEGGRSWPSMSRAAAAATALLLEPSAAMVAGGRVGLRRRLSWRFFDDL